MNLGTDIAGKDPATLFLDAINSGNVSAVARLLFRGLDSNLFVKDPEYGQLTPLCLAVLRDDIQTVRLLVYDGSKLDMPCGPQASTPLHFAVRKGNESCVTVLLKNGAPQNLEDIHGNGPLHVACIYGQRNCMELLCRHGANINAPGTKCWTPLHWACGMGHLPLVQTLRDLGADRHALDDFGVTPAVLARARGHHDCEAALTGDNTQWAGNRNPTVPESL